MDCQQSYQDTFKGINVVAHSIRALCQGDNPSPPTPHFLAPSHATLAPTLSLPVPTIPSALENTECPPQFRHSVQSAFIKSAHELRDLCYTKHDSLVKFLQSDPGRSSKAAHSIAFFERQYHERLRALEQLTIAKMVDLRQSEGDMAAKVKTTFNREFIPLLETYFNYNAYPSALDRATLARKSMMTPRQIEVWFQNHRNRAKKEGRKLKKLTMDPLPLELSLKPLEKKMPFFVIPEAQRRDPFSVAPSKTDVDLVADEHVTSPRRDPNASFDLNAPRHAFPTVYPPCCDYNPFPTKTGTYKFPAPVWYRKPAVARRNPTHPIAFDELIADFDAKLHLRVPSSEMQRSDPTRPWYASRITIPSLAPHPALVLSPVLPTSSHTSRLLAVPAPLSRLHPFRSPSPCSQPTTLILPGQCKDTSTRRKVARLPKRTPKNTSVSHRRGSPAMSEASPTPSRSSSSSSRASSFGSELSSDNRPSSSSGSSTSASSTLTTPEMPHSSLPEDAGSPSVSVSGLDFENMDSLSGSRTLSPMDGTPFNFSLTAQPKQPFTLDTVVASPESRHSSRRVPPW
ncbi:hypothetical protein FPV67DRAFT_1466729 [Lyophyllum atratum]|nr:hypothetical protein FPV67DRAFT_1466729 [Lyophyllum atratum]